MFILLNKMSNQKNFSAISANIFKSRKILLDILKKRGYNTEDWENFNINEVQIMYNNNQLDMLLETESGRKIYVKYHINNKLRENHINEYVDDLFNIEEVLKPDDELLIIIRNQNINDTLEEYMRITYIKYNIFVNIINIKKLMFNLLEHSMVPNHRILNDEEKKEMYKKFNIINDSEWQEISRFDPVAKIIGLRPGQLCEITRSSKTSIVSYNYRLCH